jgi:hypothetical protein
MRTLDELRGSSASFKLSPRSALPWTGSGRITIAFSFGARSAKRRHQRLRRLFFSMELFFRHLGLGIRIVAWSFTAGTGS